MKLGIISQKQRSTILNRLTRFPRMTRNTPVSPCPRYFTTRAHSTNGYIDFLAIAVEAHWRRGTALRETFSLCDRIREGLAASAHIWGARKHSVSIDQCLEFQDLWKQRVANGEVTMDYEAKPAVRLNV